MKHCRGLYLIALTILVPACENQPLDPAIFLDGAVAQAKGKGKPGSSDALNYTLDDAVGGVTSDGMGPYLDSEPDVEAAITRQGQAAFSTQPRKNASPDRRVLLNIVDADGPVFSGLVDVAAWTGEVDVTSLPLGTPTAIPVRIAFETGDVLHRLRFGRLCYHERADGGDPSDALVPAEMATITATTVDGSGQITNWELESSGPARLCVIPGRKGGDPSTVPNVSAPFRWSIERADP